MSSLTRPLFLHTLSRLGLLVLLIHLGIGSVFTNGLMAMPTGSGGLVLVLCTPDGPLQVVIDPVTGEETDLPDNPDTLPCDWAGLQYTAVFGAPEPVGPPSRLYLRADYPAASPVHLPAHDSRGIYARGPPAFG